MPGFSRVRYCFEPPSWPDVRAAPDPVFLAPPRLRWAWSLLARRAATSPRAVRDLGRAGVDLRGVLRFLLWLDTAACYGVERIDAAPELAPILNRCLGERGATPRPAARAPATITVVMIAKDEEARLGAALQSAGALADEIVVVVDSASTDGTAQVAREHGARVLTRSLSGDFAAQKNAGVAAARTDWVLCIDADERIEPGLAPLLRQAMTWPRADAVFVPVLNLITERGEAPVHWPDVQARCFRAHLRYRRPVHERVDRWRRPILLPLSGPYLRHEKSLLDQHRSTLRYHEIDPTPYSREMIASVREEVAQLEQAPAPSPAPGRPEDPSRRRPHP